MGKAWLITSGKGGVGKSTLAASLGVALCERGQRVCVVDADIGLRDQDAILGLADRIVYDLVDVTARRCTLDQALVRSGAVEGLCLLPAAQFARCRDLKDKAFAGLLEELKQRFDQVLIDSPAGIEKGLRNLLRAPLDEVLLVTTPDDVCIRDAERTAMLLRARELPRPQLVVNRLDAELVRAREMYPARVVAQTLDLELLGQIPEDRTVYRASLAHRTAVEAECPAAEELRRIARRMLGEDVPQDEVGTEVLPWYRRWIRRKPEELIWRREDRR